MRISKSGIMKLKTVSLLCVGSVLLCGILACSNQAKQSTEENNDEQQLFIGDNIAVAQTQYGKVKGFILKGIYNFRGVPYGASTAGENRFMPPREPEPWEGIRPAVFWRITRSVPCWCGYMEAALPTVMVLNKMVIMAKISAVMVTSCSYPSIIVWGLSGFPIFRWPVRDSKHRAMWAFSTWSPA